jgi:ABC-2 type transport system permease protein
MPGNLDFKTFIYPGVLAMSVLATSISSAGSIIWDREFGFLREILVAPVSRASIVIGKCLGGATIATCQGIIFLALAGFAHVPYQPVLLLTLAGELLLLSFTLTAFGVMMAARIKQFQAFMALTPMLIMSFFFLSGALYPLTGLPGWLAILTRIDPVTYVVGPMREAAFRHLSIPVAEQRLLAPRLTWAGWPVPQWLSLGIVATMVLAMTGIAIAQFRKTELPRAWRSHRRNSRPGSVASTRRRTAASACCACRTPAGRPVSSSRCPRRSHRRSRYWPSNIRAGRTGDVSPTSTTCPS